MTKSPIKTVRTLVSNVTKLGIIPFVDENKQEYVIIMVRFKNVKEV